MPDTSTDAPKMMTVGGAQVPHREMTSDEALLHERASKCSPSSHRHNVLANLEAGMYERMSDAEHDVLDLEQRDNPPAKVEA